MPRKKDSKDKVIKKKTKVTVSNTLNQMIFEQKDMNLQAFRMLMFYLAKINPARPDLTEVRVPLETYAEMLGVELNEQAIDASTNMLLGYVLKTGEIDAGEYIIKNAKYSVFSVCRLMERKSDGKRMLEFKCSEDVKPLIFEMQSKFTMFNVWNVLNLSNFQDIRMYMLLSQYKVAGIRTFTLEELKEKLGINKDAYPEYKIFARAVLKKCQKSLKEKTDICFEFKSVGRPAHSVYFEIFKNDEYTILKYLEDTSALDESSEQIDKNQTTIDDFIVEPAANSETQDSIFDVPKYEYTNSHVEFLAQACDYEFNQTEMNLILSELNKKSFGYNPFTEKDLEDNAKFDFIQKAYRTLNYQATKTVIDDRVTYLQGIIRNMDV